MVVVVVVLVVIDVITVVVEEVAEVVEVEVTWLVEDDEVVVGFVEVEVEVAGRHLSYLSRRYIENVEADTLRIERVAVHTGGPRRT